MIDKSLAFIKNTINQSLKNSFNLEEDILVLNHLVDTDGGSPQKNENKIVLTLINLEYETNQQYNISQRRIPPNKVVNLNPAVRFNMDILFTANFDDYNESLKFLSATIMYFQANSVMHHEGFPNMPKGLERLNFDIVNSSYSETHNLWSAMGAKYQPSIIYKARNISIQSGKIIETGTTMSGIGIGASS